MDIKEVSVEGLARELQVTIAAAEMAAKLDEKIDSIKEEVNLKGFRPGKVPPVYIRRAYGERLMGEVIQETINNSSQQILTDRNERPAMQPKIKLANKVDEILGGKADLAYNMSYEIIPAIELVDFSKLKLEKPVVEVNAAHVDEALARLATQRKDFVARGKTAEARNGDRVNIDFIGRIDGEAFEGGTGEKFDLELGAGQFIPGFEEQLVGAKAGDEVTVEVNFPVQYEASELAGKAASFACIVHAVSAPQDAEINEAFATSLGLESLDKLKQAISEQIASEYEQMSRGHLKKDLLDQLSDAHRFELPPSMVELEFNQIWRQFEQELESNNQKLEDLDDSEDDLRAEYRGIAERRVRTGLVLAEIGSHSEIQISQEELNQGLMKRAQEFPGQEQQVLEYFQKNPQAMSQIQAPIYEEKVIDFICELANVSDKKVSLDNLMAEPGAKTEDAKTKEKPKAKKAAPKKAASKKGEGKKTTAKKPAKKPAKKGADKA